MPNQPYIDILGKTSYIKATGSGTENDPYIPSFVQENAGQGNTSQGNAGQEIAVDFGTKITDSTLPAGGVGNIGWLSAIWKLITDRLPALVGGKIPVDVASLSVTLNTANLEISNDVGNPIPISDAGGSVTVDGSVSVSNFPSTFAATQSGIWTVTTGLSQPLTDAQLRATPVAVSGTFWQATQPVSLASLPALAAGSNTIGSIANTTFASTQSGTWNITNISGTISLPTGAATSANQSTANTSLNSIDAKTPALGPATAANSTPITLANDGVFAVNFGATVDSAASSDTGTFSLIALIKRILTKIPQLTTSSTRLLVDGSGVTQPISRSERTYTRFRVDTSTSGDNTIIAAPGAGLSIYIAELVVINKSNTATLVLLREGASTIGDIDMPAKGDGIVLSYSFDSEWKLPANTALVSNLSGNNNIAFWGRFRTA